MMWNLKIKNQTGAFHYTEPEHVGNVSQWLSLMHNAYVRVQKDGQFQLSSREEEADIIMLVTSIESK